MHINPANERLTTNARTRVRSCASNPAARARRTSKYLERDAHRVRTSGAMGRGAFVTGRANVGTDGSRGWITLRGRWAKWGAREARWGERVAPFFDSHDAALSRIFTFAGPSNFCHPKFKLPHCALSERIVGKVLDQKYSWRGSIIFLFMNLIYLDPSQTKFHDIEFTDFAVDREPWISIDPGLAHGLEHTALRGRQLHVNYVIGSNSICCGRRPYLFRGQRDVRRHSRAARKRAAGVQ
ncbi:hypothetical protein B0H12DRAFT_1078139 [Mycena haematopus]|nr:hypothetical protein B0H12DRAFT_1078139 [Mycena haematopus]